MILTSSVSRSQARLFLYYLYPKHKMSKRFSAADVASHKTPSDLWIIVDEDVYDLTNFQEEHPGGKKSKPYVAYEHGIQN